MRVTLIHSRCSCRSSGRNWRRRVLCTTSVGQSGSISQCSVPGIWYENDSIPFVDPCTTATQYEKVPFRISVASNQPATECGERAAAAAAAAAVLRLAACRTYSYTPWITHRLPPMFHQYCVDTNSSGHQLNVPPLLPTAVLACMCVALASIAVGIAWPNHLAVFCNVYLYILLLAVCHQTARLSKGIGGDIWLCWMQTGGSFSLVCRTPTLVRKSPAASIASCGRFNPLFAFWGEF